jgi:hypothetical protein
MSAEYYRRKADQAYEMAGLAAKDGDAEEASRLTAEAKEYDRLALETS